jgi:hypothetical protein
VFVEALSMGLTFLTGYVLGQHGRQSARLAASAAAGMGPSLDDLLEVHERIDRLVLVLGAMWSLLEEGGYTPEQLQTRIEEMDAADGTVDGKRTAQIVQCRNCGAKVAAGLPACQFCGTDVPGDTTDPLGSV